MRSLLADGEMEVRGRMPWSSNNTFLVALCEEGEECLAIYKPGRGERPLWDFPGGLYRRERAAYVLAEALGWHIVPETVLRDGPFGVGSVQRFVAADFEQHYFTLLEDERFHDELRRVGAFDLLANNADRKGGHTLLGDDGRIWAIDHGLCFHEEPKLRTVIWDFAGECIAEGLVADVARIAAELPGELARTLDGDELEALAARAERLVAHPEFPAPGYGRPYPWPLV